MKTVTAAAFCTLLSLASAGAKQRLCTLRIHTEANARDGAVFSSTIRSQFTGKNVVIEKTPTLSERDVVAFRPYPAQNGSYGVLLQFDDHGKIALDALSIERRGGFLSSSSTAAQSPSCKWIDASLMEKYTCPRA